MKALKRVLLVCPRSGVAGLILNYEDVEGDEIDNCERAEKQGTNEKMLGRLDVFAPEQSSDGGKEFAMNGYKAVSAFGGSSENG